MNLIKDIFLGNTLQVSTFLPFMIILQSFHNQLNDQSSINQFISVIS